MFLLGNADGVVDPLSRVCTVGVTGAGNVRAKDREALSCVSLHCSPGDDMGDVANGLRDWCSPTLEKWSGSIRALSARDESVLKAGRCEGIHRLVPLGESKLFVTEDERESEDVRERDELSSRRV